VYVVDGETLRQVARVRGGAADFWYPFQWTGFRPRAAALDQPVEFAGVPDTATTPPDSAVRPDSGAPPAVPRDTTVRRAPGWTVSFAALLVPERARELASQIHVGTETARVITATRDGSTIYRVVLGPYTTREDAERVGRESRNSYWVYEGGP
jgi:cell division septation protein DedD